MQIDTFYFPDDLYYDRNHFWARVEGALVVMGPTDFYQQSVGEITAVEFNVTAGKVEQGQMVASVQPGDWLGPVCAVVSGEIIKVNEELKTNPPRLNKSPYKEGWLLQIKPTHLEADLARLITSGPKLEEMIEEEIAWLQEIFHGRRPCC